MKKRGYFKIQEICLKIFLEQWFLREVCMPLQVLYIGCTVTYMKLHFSITLRDPLEVFHRNPPGLPLLHFIVHKLEHWFSKNVSVLLRCFCFLPIISLQAS